MADLITNTPARRESRDFRKAFYSSLGIPVIGTKQTIETVLQDPFIDVDRVGKLCLFFRLPHAYRIILWKILLGYIPPCQDAWTFVERQREIQLEDLKRGTCLMYFDFAMDDHSKFEINSRTMIHMALLKHNIARKYDESKLQRMNFQHLFSLANVFLEMCENDSDAFWLFYLFSKSQNLLSPTYLEQPFARVQHQVNALVRLLHGIDQRLASLLLQTSNGLEALVQSWFVSYFSEILPSASLARIYDVILGGSPSISIYTALSLILFQEQKLLNSTANKKETIKDVMKVPNDACELVVNQAIDMWEKSQAFQLVPETKKQAL